MHYKTLREEVAIHIRNKILAGAYHPGDKIIELDLANELKISRAPIREALMLMEREGLVTYNPNRGCTVRVLEPRDVWQIYLLRANLEILSIKACAGKLPDQTLLNLHRCLDRFRDVSPRAELSECAQVDEDFHSEIVRAAGLPRLYDAWKNYNGVNIAIFYTIFHTRLIHFEEQEASHGVLVESLKKHMQDHSCRLVKEHYQSSCRSLFDSDEQGEAYFSSLL